MLSNIHLGASRIVIVTTFRALVLEKKMGNCANLGRLYTEQTPAQIHQPF